MVALPVLTRAMPASTRSVTLGRGAVGAGSAAAVPVGLAWTPDSDVHGRGFWSVTRHEDLVTVSRDTDTYSSAVGHIQIYDIDGDALDARASMIDTDPPMHTRLRRLVSSAFTPPHVQDYRVSVRRRVRRALDQLAPGGRLIAPVGPRAELR